MRRASVAALALALVAMALGPGVAAAQGPAGPAGASRPAGPASTAGMAHEALPAAVPPASAAAARRKPPPAAPVKLVDLNSASKAELKTLPGIGDAEAEAIVSHRPYLTKTELVTKKVLPTGPYLSLKNKVVALQKPRRAPPPTGKPP